MFSSRCSPNSKTMGNTVIKILPKIKNNFPDYQSLLLKLLHNLVFLIAKVSDMYTLVDSQ